MRINNNISFGGHNKFLQTHQDLICAYCGKRMIAEIELKRINRILEGKKGKAVAEILSPYTELMPQHKQEPLKSIIEYANESKNQNKTFKPLALMIKEKNIYTNETLETLRRIMTYIRFSVDHIIAKSNGGENKTTNYLPMHIGCNSGRSSAPYSQLAQENPDFLKNLKKSLKVLKDKNDAKIISLPDNYFQKVKEAMKKQGMDITSLSDF